MAYVIEITPNCWIASWEGDPGRTTKIENASQYRSKKDAELKLKKVIETHGEHRDFSFSRIYKNL